MVRVNRADFARRSAPNITAMGHLQVEIAWDEPLTGGSPITGYRIEVATMRPTEASPQTEQLVVYDGAGVP